jgi:GT2 family glycosyltransferase
MGCNHSARAKVLKQVHGYDMNYRGQSLFEETDLAIRIWKSGGIIVYDPTVHLFHYFAPVGGCRIPAIGKPYPEWWVPFNRHYFAFRHLRYRWEFWKSLFYKDLRETVFRKANLKMPWVIPWSFISYFYSMMQAGVMAFRKESEETSLGI